MSSVLNQLYKASSVAPVPEFLYARAKALGFSEALSQAIFSSVLSVKNLLQGKQYGISPCLITSYQTDAAGQRIALPFKFPIDPVISVNFKKRVVSKNIVKGDIPVHQIIQNNGAEINIIAILRKERNLAEIYATTPQTAENLSRIMPVDQMQNLHNLASYNGFVKVESPVFDIFNIKKAVITGVQFPDNEGHSFEYRTAIIRLLQAREDG